MRLDDSHFEAFMEQGYAVVEGFYPEEKRARIAALLRRIMPPWEELREDPPEGGLLRDDFPYEEQYFNHLVLDPDLIGFVRRVLDTEEIHFRYAHNWTRYPNGPRENPLHRDNGNNSLLPPCRDVRYGQVSTWYFPEDVPEDRAPMMVIPKEFGDDTGQGGAAGGAGEHADDLQHLPVALGHGVPGERGAALLGDPDLRPRRPLLGGGPQLHQPGVGGAFPGVHRLDRRRGAGAVPVSPGRAFVLRRGDPGRAGGALPWVERGG